MTQSPPNPSDADLLRRYVHANDQSAFQSLAARHLQWIYSAALRQTRSAPLAEDVTQGVLLTLSQKAPKLLHHPSLTSWLFRATRYGALALLRAEARRKHHEESAMPKSSSPPTDPAWSDLEPHIDSALARLPEPDRQVILLRFYQQLTHPAVAATLNITEEAARKRTDRALEKLRSLLKISSPTLLPTLLFSKLLLPLPPALTPALPALAPSTLAAAKGIQTMFILHNLKIAAAVLLLAAVPAAVTTIILTEKSAAQTPPPITQFVGTSATQPLTRDAIHSYSLSTYQLDPVSNGKPRLITQIFFDLDHGTLDKHFLAPDRTLTTLDDGAHLYTLRSDTPSAIVKPSAVPPALRRETLNIFLNFYTENLGPHHPEMDEMDSTGNEKLACHTWYNPAPLKGTTPMSYVWLDSQGLPRQSTTVITDPRTNLATITRVEITYNPDIPLDTWKFPAASTVHTVLEQDYAVPLDPNNSSVLLGTTIHDSDHGKLTHESIPSMERYFDLDDGKKSYSWKEDSSEVTARTSFNPKKTPEQLANLAMTNLLLTTPHPELDKYEDGKKLSCYAALTTTIVVSKTPSTYLHFVWLDPEKRVRHFEMNMYSTDTGKLLYRSRADYTYNPTLPPDIWKLPDNADITDGDPTLAERFPAHGAYASTQSDDRIFSIHSYFVEPNGNTYIMCSLQPTDDLRASVGKNLDAIPSDLIPRFPPLPDYTIVPFATFRGKGIQVYYLVLVAKVPNPKPPTLTITFPTFTTTGALQDESITLPPKHPPQHGVTLDGMIEDAFRAAKQYKDYAETKLLIQSTSPDGHPTITSAPFDKWTQVTFRNNLLPRLTNPSTTP